MECGSGMRINAIPDGRPIEFPTDVNHARHRVNCIELVFCCIANSYAKHRTVLRP